MKTHYLVGPGLVIGLLAVVSTARADTAPANRPGTPATPRHQVNGPNLPDNLARKFGRGAAGAETAKRVLSNKDASVEDVQDALSALTYHGHTGATALAGFAAEQARRHRGGENASAPWNLPIAMMMAKAPDRCNLMTALRWAENGEDPRLRVAALNVLTSLVASAANETALKGGAQRYDLIPRTAALQGWRSVGESIHGEDLNAINVVLRRTRKTAPPTPDESNARMPLEWWINTHEGQARGAGAPAPPRLPGAPAPGRGGFGAPPARG